MLHNNKYLIIDSRPYGFFSILLHTIDNIKWAEKNEFIPVVRWGPGRINPNLNRAGADEATRRGHPSYVKDRENFVKEIDWPKNIKQSLYYQKEYGENMWNYFFEPINDSTVEQALSGDHKISDIFMLGDFDFDNSNKFLIKNVHSYEPLVLWDMLGTHMEKEHRRSVNQVIAKYIKLKKDISQKFENFYNKKFTDSQNYLGIHVRGTDKKLEYPHTTVPLEFYAKLAENEIKELGGKTKLVIASDNNEAIIFFAQRFGRENIIAYPSQRASNYLNSIPLFFSEVKDRKTIGEEVMIEVLMLSKCNTLIGTDSNVTAGAAYFNPEMKIVYLNRILGKLK